MRYEAVSFLAALPFAMATMSILAYHPPAELLAQSQSDSSCNFPADFHIQNFVAKTNETGPAATLSAYNFTFVDKTTSVTTRCSFNSSSVSTTPTGLTPRYACADGDVKFIWDNAHRQLTVVERICPNAKGIDSYEVSGSAVIALSCTGSGSCSTNSTDLDVQYTALDPVQDPTLRVKYWVS
ncbi:uncharacterized protein TrAFT101_007108 [Trichoderma asperellum]|nr:hypothetical protein TrAFT101_007108 [Trichoderma asperellum]